jgi:hypothetical protein
MISHATIKRVEDPILDLVTYHIDWPRHAPDLIKEVKIASCYDPVEVCRDAEPVAVFYEVLLNLRNIFEWEVADDKQSTVDALQAAIDWVEDNWQREDEARAELGLAIARELTYIAQQTSTTANAAYNAVLNE